MPTFPGLIWSNPNNKAPNKEPYNIREAKTLAEIQAFLPKGIGPFLIIKDLDETTLFTPRIFGSGVWVRAFRQELIKTFERKKEQAVSTVSYFQSFKDAITGSLLQKEMRPPVNKTPKEVTEVVMQRFAYAQDKTPGCLVEGDRTREFVDSMNDEHHLLFVTARPAIYKTTLRQLDECKISYNYSPKFKDKEVPLHVRIPNCHAINGVIFTYSTDKGVCVEEYLKAIGCNAAREFVGIIGIDDKLEKLEQLAAAAERLGIPFMGFHYTAFNQDLGFTSAEILQIGQLQYQHQINTNNFMTDQEACNILSIRRKNNQKVMSKL